MKIAIAAEVLGTDTRMARVFGRCSTFVFIDTDTGATRAEPNPAQHATGGAGVEAANFVIDHGTEVVIVPRIGPNAQIVLDDAGIRFHVHASGTVREALDAFLKRESS